MQIPAKPARQFNWPVRIYYEDTDAAGVVYHTNYLKYCERARTEWLRTIGLDQRNMRAESGLVFVVRRLEAEYLQGAELDDMLVVQSVLSSIGGASFVFDQCIMRGSERLFVAKVSIACVDWNKRRPARLPDNVKALLETPA